MFIAYTKNDGQFVENSVYQNRTFTWDDIPQDIHITALALTHPVPFIINNKRISPKVSIKKYHYYYFFNEATISILQSESGGQKQQEVSLVAKVMAGIDVDREYVLEIRLDKSGNTSINSYPLQALVKKFDAGQMRRSVLRAGSICPIGKSLI